MSRRKLATGYSVVLAALMMPSIHAQDQGFHQDRSRPQLIPNQVQGQPPGRLPALSASHSRGQDPGMMGMAPAPIDADRAQGAPDAAGGPPQQQGYVRLGAPMYPSPRPNIPIWTGSTMITNQAFAPQEMLYPHTYRAMYPPFYHRVKGGWLLTPLGVRSHERWELQGTMVQVKYRSSYPGLLSGAFWHPPATAYSHGGLR